MRPAFVTVDGMTVADATLDLLRHLATKPGHTEVLASIRDLLVRELGASLGDLDFERRVPEVKGRLDALIGRTVFEAKSDLAREWGDVERRMPDYLADREREEGAHFIGIASDGRAWQVFELRDGALVKIKATTLDPAKPEAFLAWLDGAVALQSELAPDGLNIRAELGQDSVAYHLVRARLAELWASVASVPAEALKRRLWADLLRLVYGRDVDSDALWFQHTYLVVIAKSIALAVMGLDEGDPARLLSGEAFVAAGIDGAVESDFFDWVVAAPGGDQLVRRIVSHVRRFRLRDVESDVLKILYESLIDRDERHGLGEYYTPDWLAAKIVRAAVTAPLEQKVLDPACGSGTFLFHAVRTVLAEAVDAGMDKRTIAAEATKLVAGTDIHPVAVIIARVTYLLALAPALADRAGSLSVPVFLGDAMQLSISQMLNGKELVIRVPPPPAGDGRSGEADAQGREQLDFPETFCRDGALFDKMIKRMREATLADTPRTDLEAALERLTVEHYLKPINPEQVLAVKDMGKTYVTMDRLRREGRDTIWSYVARNLARPLAFSAGGGWANVVVGNPPWVAYRHMSDDLQKRFKELAKEEGIYVSRVPSHNDLSALFAVRSTQLYLRAAGRVAFVLPLAALTRNQFGPFRTGKYTSVNVAWDGVWTMDDSVYPLFPVPSCVVLGRKRGSAVAIPSTVRAYSGNVVQRDAPEEFADPRLTVVDGAPALHTAQATGGSTYRRAFRAGAILYPRMLVMVTRKSAGRLGVDTAAPLIESWRSVQEKEPWSRVEAVVSNVEAQFLRGMLLGESITPYRVIRAFEVALPVLDDGTILSEPLARKMGYDHLANRMVKTELIWLEHGKGRYLFSEHLDYMRQLSGQFPIAPLRVVYAKSGSQPAATIVRDDRAVIDHKLYWTTPDSEDEAYYLAAVLNSETVRAAAAGYQSRGQFGARDFDKVAFNLPIPRFAATVPLHVELADAGRRAEAVAAAVDLPAEGFVRLRGRVRAALTADGVAGEIDALVARLLGL